MSETPLSCGTGLGNVILPGDPSLDTSILSAQSALMGIAVSWTYPNTNPHAVAYTFLYRSTQNDFDTAVLIRTVSGDYHLDQYEVTEGTTFYYWIRMVSVNGTVGNVIGPASAQRLPSVEQLIELLVGRLDDSVLVQDLKTRINEITNVASALDAETQNRLLGDDVLSQLLAGLADDLSDIDTLVANEITERISGDSALVAAVDMILAKANDNAAAILQESGVRADADSAIAFDVQTLQATVGDTSSSLQTLQQVVNGPEGLSAQFMVKTDVNGYVSGFGLYSDETFSEFIINADRFAVIKPGQNSVYPFIIDNVNGEPVIALNATALIPDAQITNAMIGNFIQSNNYNGTTQGWRIDKNGSANFSSIVIRNSNGQVLLSSGTGMEYSFVNNGPPANATRGAPAGTLVGNVPAENVAGSLSVVAGLSDDNVLTPTEKVILRREWESLQKAYFALRWVALNRAQVSVTALENAYVAVGNQLSTFAWGAGFTGVPNRLTASGDTIINGSGLTSAWAGFWQAYRDATEAVDGVFVSPGNRITSGNVSTYIANLAVDTLQIAGNAVTIPEGVSGNSGVLLTTFWQTVGQITMSFPANARPSAILVQGFLSIQNMTGSQQVNPQLAIAANAGSVTNANAEITVDAGRRTQLACGGRISGLNVNNVTLWLRAKLASASTACYAREFSMTALGAKK